MTPGFSPRAGFSRRRAAAASAVLGAHVVVLFAIWEMKVAAAPQARDAVRDITLRLLSKPVEPRMRERVEPPLQPALPRISLLPPPQMTEGLGPPVVQGASSIGLDGTASAAAPGLPASGPRGLNLTPSRDVLRGALANPATSDPRSNSPVPTFEERIAMGLDPDLCLLTERMPDGSTRRRLTKYKRVQSTMSAVHAQGQGSARICE